MKQHAPVALNEFVVRGNKINGSIEAPLNSLSQTFDLLVNLAFWLLGQDDNPLVSF